jgi:hypothetical protein
MEPTMTRLTILSTVAILALAAPLVIPTESFAQRVMQGPGAGARHAGPHFGGGGAARFQGGGYRGGGGGWHGHRGGGGGGFIPGAIAGAVIGGALAAPYYAGSPYYGGSTYYATQPYEYEEEPVVEVVPGGGDDVGYCIQRFRSYDVRSGTYLGNDGYRHPCP